MKDVDGASLLMTGAAYAENPGIVEILLKAGADLEEKDGDQWTPLMYAASLSEAPLVTKALIAAGADMKAKDAKGLTAFMIAARDSEMPEVLQVFLDAGADPNERDADGTSVIAYAATNADPRAVEILAKAGADVNSRDKWKMTPLMVAAQFNEGTETPAALIKLGADLNAKDKDGEDSPHTRREEREKHGNGRLPLQGGSQGEGKYDGAGRARPPAPNQWRRYCPHGEELARRSCCYYAPRRNFCRIPADEFLAICADRSPEAVAKAIEEGADVNVRNNKGQTAPRSRRRTTKTPGVIEVAARTGRRCRRRLRLTGAHVRRSAKQKPRRGAGLFEGRRRRRFDHRRPDGPDTGGGVEPEPPSGEGAPGRRGRCGRQGRVRRNGADVRRDVSGEV